MLEEANREPDYVKREDSIEKATTLMLQKGYSQLPVSSNSLQQHSIVGYISWQTIALKQVHGSSVHEDSCGTVADYMHNHVCILPLDTPILEAMESVHKHGFILVSSLEKRICGMITAAEMNSSYRLLTEKFLLVEQIERQIRLLLDNRYTLAEINTLISTEENQEEVQSIDDLTFGQYIRIIESPDNWDKLSLSFDKAILHTLLNDVRDIRNDIMHFDPSGIDSDQLDKLSEICKFLATVIKLSRGQDC
nr:CBS domain-containing protein [uncultured Porphyromonas sp.]